MGDLVDKYAEHYIEKKEYGVTFETVTRSGSEDMEILKFARKEQLDLILVGTHGRTGIQRLLFASVAEKVLRHSPFPVFVIPCKKNLDPS